MKLAFWVTVFCGACPLVAGLSIFLLWLVTRWNWLEGAGLITLFGGGIFFLIGIIPLMLYRWFAARVPEPALSRTHLRRAEGCAALLLSNFVVAGGIIAAVVLIEHDSQTQQIVRVGEAQRISFHARGGDDGAHHINSITFHIHGHLDGKASITDPISREAHPISGDVDWNYEGDYYSPTIEFKYAPTQVTSGQLTFEVTFH